MKIGEEEKPCTRSNVESNWTESIEADGMGDKKGLSSNKLQV